MAALQLAAQHEAGAEPRADREEHEVVDALRDAEPPLAERGEIDVVLERDALAQPLFEICGVAPSVQPRNVRREPDGAGLLLDDARDADDGLVDQLVRQAGRADERVAQLDDRVERALGVDAAVLDVLAGADRAGEVAERPAQEARAEVDARG